MEFTLTTEQLQDVVIALICNDSTVLKKKQDLVDALIDTFAEMNRMCKPENGYAVSVSVASAKTP